MSGIGAFLYGARWNSPGRHIVYASGNLSLAMLEVLVHVDDAEAFLRVPHVYHAVRFPEAIVATLDPQALPAGWDARPESRASQTIGNEWFERRSSAVLAVPSVITPAEQRFEALYMNYLINPHHPDIGEVEVGAVHGLTWDPRLR